MKAILFLPAHPSYFDGDFTESDVNRALLHYDEFSQDALSRGTKIGTIPIEYRLLREPGHTPRVETEGDFSGIKGLDDPEAEKQRFVDQLEVQLRGIGMSIQGLLTAARELKNRRGGGPETT